MMATRNAEEDLDELPRTHLQWNDRYSLLCRQRFQLLALALPEEQLPVALGIVGGERPGRGVRSDLHLLQDGLPFQK